MSFRKKTVTTAYINAAVRSTLIIQCSGGTSVQDHMTGRRRWRRGGECVQDHMTGRWWWRRGGECEVVPLPCVGRLGCGVHRRCIRQSHKCWTWSESIMNRKLWGKHTLIKWICLSVYYLGFLFPFFPWEQFGHINRKQRIGQQNQFKCETILSHLVTRECTTSPAPLHQIKGRGWL